LTGIVLLALSAPRVGAQSPRGAEAPPQDETPEKMDAPNKALKASPSSETALQPSVLEVARQIVCQCPDCGKQTVDQCAPGCAEGQQHRAAIEKQINEGKTAAQIVNFFGDTQGEHMLATPRAKGFGAAAYLLPSLFVLLTLIPLALTLNSRRRIREARPVTTGDAATADSKAPANTQGGTTPSDDARVQAALRDYDF
jgi:cytochrome c-type biogenesis protein CcmH/NrfF